MGALAPVAAIALTGGIGSGKSTVASMLVARGAALIDTDAIARSLTTPGGAAMPAITSVFGAEFLAADGALDRPRMRALAFADAGAKARLEAILHPMIAVEAERQALRADGPVLVFDVPLLGATSSWRRRAQRVLVVDCGEDTQARRVAQRPGWDLDTARSVIAQQMPRAQRRRLADAVICNDGISLDLLHTEVLSLWTLWFGDTVPPQTG